MAFFQPEAVKLERGKEHRLQKRSRSIAGRLMENHQKDDNEYDDYRCVDKC
jgi:hypothetical protein